MSTSEEKTAARSGPDRAVLVIAALLALAGVAVGLATYHARATAGYSPIGARTVPFIIAGALIVLAGFTAIAGIDAPTFKESGVDVTIQNWRMVAAAPGISAEQKAAITADIEKMVNSPAWQKTLTDKGWANTYLAGDAFSAQLKKDVDATGAILKDIGLVK